MFANEGKRKEKYKLPEIKELTTTYISIGTLREAINQGTTLATEMPTPGNLKPGDSLFCITHTPPPPTSAQSPDNLRTLYEILHEVQTIIIRFYDLEGEIIFVSDEIRTKRPQKPNYESKKIGILRKNGKNPK